MNNLSNSEVKLNNSHTISTHIEFLFNDLDVREQLHSIADDISDIELSIKEKKRKIKLISPWNLRYSRR